MKAAIRHHHTTGNHKSGDHSLTDDLGDLRENFVQLRNDVSELMHNAAGVGRSAVRDTAASAMDGIKDQLDGLKEKAVQSRDTVVKQITARPMTSALIAVGIGFILSRLFTRR